MGVEILSYGSARCLPGRSLNSHQSRLATLFHGVCNTKIVSRSGFVKFYNVDQSFLLNKGQQRGSRLVNPLESSKRINSKVYSAKYDGYVIGTAEVARDIAGIEEPTTSKVSFQVCQMTQTANTVLQ